MELEAVFEPQKAEIHVYPLFFVVFLPLLDNHCPMFIMALRCKNK